MNQVFSAVATASPEILTLAAGILLAFGIAIGAACSTVADRGRVRRHG